MVYNLIIVPASLWSAATNSYYNHQQFWTEKDANAWATVFFGLKSAIGQNASFPKEFTDKFEQIKKE